MVFPIIPRNTIFQKSALDIKSPSLLIRRIITIIIEAKNMRIPLNARGDNSRSAILTKEKLMAQNNTAKSIKRSVVPNFLYSFILFQTKSISNNRKSSNNKLLHKIQISNLITQDVKRKTQKEYNLN